jgi:hypothetical protein
MEDNYNSIAKQLVHFAKMRMLECSMQSWVTGTVAVPLQREILAVRGVLKMRDYILSALIKGISVCPL